jgi:hypothetical protein
MVCTGSAARHVVPNGGHVLVACNRHKRYPASAELHGSARCVDLTTLQPGHVLDIAYSFMSSMRRVLPYLPPARTGLRQD